MNKTIIAIGLALCCGAAFAQSGAATATAGKNTDTVSASETKDADAFCVRETGTHLRSITAKPHNERAVDCAGSSPGRTYTREDIERTGAMNTADAIRRLSPIVR